MTFDSYTRDLNAQKCGKLFIWLLAAAAALVVLVPQRQIVIVGAALFLATYIYVIWYSQDRYVLVHSIEVKNSPYIFGFLLTLIAISNLFIQSGSTLLTDSVNRDFVVTQIGVAMISSIIGLLGRQILIAKDPAESAQDRVMDSLAQTMRENASAIDTAQKEMAAVLKDSVEHRQTLFLKEEQAFQTFVTNLSQGGQILKEIEQTYPERLRIVLEGFNTHITTLATQVETATTRLTEMVETATGTQQQMTDSTTHIIESLDHSATALPELHSKMMKAMQTSSDGLTNAQQVATEAQTTVVNSLTETKDAIAAISTQASSLAETLEQATTTITTESGRVTTIINELPGSMKTTVNQFSDEAIQNAAQLQQRQKDLLDELKTMEEILDQVTTLWERKLTETT